jgi:hypothetical protein
MPLSLSQLPDLQALTAGLTAVLDSPGQAAGAVVVLDRRPNLEGSFPHEVVTCRLGGAGERRLFCKYGIGHTVSGQGHRGGVRYEAEVYRQVLQPSPLAAAGCYGAHTDPATGATWLLLEYLDRAVQVSRAQDPAAMGLAADWAGRFHAAHEVRPAGTPPAFLTRYGAEYYALWARRTAQFAADLHPRYPWLAPLCRRFEEAAVSLLLAPPLVVIHGEYYPKNILYRPGVVYPVDWESAAVARGEIDLASLVEKWPADVERHCKAAYLRARWPAGAPADFARALDAARAYLHLRWLGDQPDWAVSEKSRYRYDCLHLLGQRLGLI